MQSSRVGHNTKACGNFKSGLIKCKSGNPKAAVLPVPVLAKPTRSRGFCISSGIACS